MAEHKPEVLNVVRSGQTYGNRTCDTIIQTAPRNRTLTYQIHYKNNQIVNQTINVVTTATINNGYLIETDKSNITAGPLAGHVYYGIRYFNNSDFYQCNKEPGLTNLRQLSGVLYFVHANNLDGMFSCRGSGYNKFHPGMLFAYVDADQAMSWVESGKQLAMDFLPYLFHP
ncbi:unnamed protein product [Medioppia subpectinata]|uniref:Uncharacterized protein n=1 Tax=Medioppia subpectinata TaxID=1979941 RepID=A0A7R9KNP3_9ACAR|nr:unnamed protein product [Medioppia subpectinata]CAD7626474.1 unnamed protein product [Medioppia subpectinata]CAG2106903.1 unnamed protein product [Medioppia subpectinata]CAG2106904.1 unnamed protein product [Medioppia subpectinata]